MRAAASRRFRIRLLALLLLGAVTITWRYLSLKNGWCLSHARLRDYSGLLARKEACQAQRFLDAFQRESSVDIRFLIVRGTAGVPMEQFGLQQARALGLGRETGRRGLLFVYDADAGQMRVEIGSKLEGVFTDAFVGYLIRENLRSFVATRRLDLGIRSTMIMVSNRIRQSILGEEYDPRIAEFIEDRRRLAVGAGTTARVTVGDTAGAFHNREATPAERDWFAPQPTVDEAYSRYQDWLAMGATPSNAPLFTGPSQEWLRDLPITNAFGEFALFLEHGQPYRIVERGDLAMVYYTATPFAAPHFFRHGPAGWQMDILAEVLNTTPAVGGSYSWSTYNSGDEYARRFGDLWVSEGRAGRIAGGDNRPLPVGRRSWEDRVRSLYQDSGSLPIRRPPPIDTLDVVQAAELVRAARGRRVVVVFYETSVEFERGLFAQLTDLAATDSARLQVVALSVDQPEDLVWLPWLFERHSPTFAARWLRPWSRGQFIAAFSRIGVTGELLTLWTRPLVMVLDRDGTVLLLADGVTDIAPVRAALATGARAEK